MDWLTFFFILIVSSWALVGIWRWYADSKGMIDHPNVRSSHKIPTPRGGGMVVSLGWFILLGVLYQQEFLSFAEIEPFLPALLIIVIGIYDDIKGASRWVRLLLQLIAAALFMWFIGEFGQTLASYSGWGLPWWGFYVMTVLGIVWITNVFNFMDGTDGFATLQSLIIFGFGGWALWIVNAQELAILAWSLCALLFGFLVWNWPVAKIFMGDSGSAPLGLLVCMFAFLAHECCQVSLYFWIILSSPFWYDASITLLRRIIARENWREAHKLHAYQRMIQLGWSHQKLLFWSLIVNAGCMVLAYKGLGRTKQWPTLLGVDLVYLTVIYLIIEIRKPMYKSWYGKKY